MFFVLSSQVHLRPERLGATADKVSNSGAAATKTCETINR